MNPVPIVVAAAKKRILYMAIYFAFFIIPLTAQAQELFLTDDFYDLKNWDNYYFPGDKKPTKYFIESNNINSFLRMESDSSASGLILKNTFNPIIYPVLNWRWKVENIINGADGMVKSGDDYAIRIFVMFRMHPEKQSWFNKLYKGAVELLSGYIPPDKTLVYVWSNIMHKKPFFPSPYSDSVIIIPLRSGDKNMSTWKEEQVNIIEDYQKVFNTTPPEIATIAIMSDTDNTGKKALAFLDKLEIRK